MVIRLILDHFHTMFDKEYIANGCILIAKFMDEHPQPDNPMWWTNHRYDTDWNLLMGAVFRIIELAREEELDYHENYDSVIDTIPCCIEDAFKVVVEFIEFWNEYFDYCNKHSNNEKN